MLYDGVCEALDDLHPEVVIVESLYSKYRHPRTAILMGHARGVIYLAAQERSLQVEAYPASQVKRALTGAGRAGKDQVAEMVCRLLSLAEAPRPFDVTDALALALCHANPQRFGGERKLPASVREALPAGPHPKVRGGLPGGAGVSPAREPHPLTPSPCRGGGTKAAAAGAAPRSRSLATRVSRLATPPPPEVRP